LKMSASINSGHPIFKSAHLQIFKLNYRPFAGVINSGV
jgi:hypothetical protein